jgi:hypothetical protein
VIHTLLGLQMESLRAFSCFPFASCIELSMIIYLAADLLWASKIKSTAEAIGIPARPARNGQMLTDRLADSPVTAILLDLDAGPVAFELLQIATAARSATTPPKAIRICCFGPHVQADELRQAKAQGADVVLARGALHANLPGYLTSLHQGQAVRSQMED